MPRTSCCLQPRCRPSQRGNLLPQIMPQNVAGPARTLGAGRCGAQSASGSAATLKPARDLQATAGASATRRWQSAVPPNDARSDDVTFHTNTPPPPFRGGLPAAQPIASPSIAPDAPLATTAHHLLDDTDAAIARQTLLQVASLPDRIDTPIARVDPPRRAGISKFRSSRRKERRWRSSRFRVMATAAKSKLPSGSGGRGSRSMSSRRARSMRWCRSPATRPRCECGPNGLRPPRSCAPAPRNSARR